MPLTQGSGIKDLLPYGGNEVEALYKKMKSATSGWWYNDGDFTFEEFNGLMIIHEGNGWEGVEAEWVAMVAAQQLYEEGGWVGPYCPGSTCVNGAFNFWAYRESVRNLINIYVRGGAPTDGYYGFKWLGLSEPAILMEKAAELGNMMLHPTSLWHGMGYNTPVDWGNNPAWRDKLRSADIRERQFVGMVSNLIVYYNDTFIVYTVNQSNYWAMVPPPQ